MKWNPLVLLGIVLSFWSNVYADSFEPARIPSLVSSLKIATPLEFCKERVPVENQEIKERLEKELLLSLWDRPQVILWLKRSSRYLPHIERMLGQSGMPNDLKYVCIAESAFLPRARSPKGAVGLWQFMKYTGRKYGLVINRRIDERRNMFSSTEAAINYFKDLYGTFESWTLAAAAYNMGEDGLMVQLLEQGSDDYYNLYLPLETQRYIFRILSIKLIFLNPERYGFQLPEEAYYPLLKFDRIHVNCRQETPIRIIAQAAKTNFKTIKDLNPDIRGHYLPKGNHAVLIPKGTSQEFQDRYQHLVEQWSSAQKERMYLVQEGDNLSAIADRFGVPLSALIIWNHLNPKAHIHPGDRLIIYREDLQSGEIDQNDSANNTVLSGDD
ncbi:MAG: transglycosylase SLT domain-containing protein [Deltaproteobacteria bacterium]|nr:MAG: transglycosylase SLT domain-containing protein [Deltaproteobacteria bacterium]